MRLLILLIILLIPCAAFSQSREIKNLVFEGAGIRGIAYSGVIKHLEERNLISNIDKVGGTSAGAITALLVFLGYQSDESYDIISKSKFHKFNDGKYIFVGGIFRMFRKYGWYVADAFTKWIETEIEDKTGDANITLQQLKEAGFKQLYVTATCINKQKLLILSAETYPKMKVKDAVRISMSIPLYFEAMFIDSIGNVFKNPRDGEELDIVVDGGVIGNYPIFIFDEVYLDSFNQEIRIPNSKTLGIRIDSDEQIASDDNSKQIVSKKVENVVDYLEAFYVLILENLNRNKLTEADWERTISVSSVGVGPKIKKLSVKEKMKLIECGEKHANNYFERK